MADDSSVLEGSAFISYASADAAIANSIVGVLEQSGIRCWIAPRDVVPGSLYADGIVKAINGTQHFVLVLSEHALASKHVGKELERASSKGHPILAIRTDAAPLTPAFEYFLSESQWVDVGAGGIDAAASRLASALAGAASLERPAASEPKASRSRVLRRTVWSIGAVAAVNIFAALWWYAVDHGRTAPRAVATTPGLATPSPSETSTIADKSIAVLPFVDMSEKQDQQYFGDGVAEEILDLLAKVPGLRVIGRTSSFQFRGKSEDLRTIGSVLGVGHIVEGSIRRSGERVRVTAQLIRTSDGFHEWSKSYDKNVEDVLEVQETIAIGIARALQVAVEASPSSGSEVKSLDAYDLYLRGLHEFDHYDERGFEESENYFKQALSIDPSFTRAAESLAFAHFLQADWGYVKPEVGFEQARKEAEQLLRSNPNSRSGHALLARIHTDYDWNWEAARRETDTTLRLAPSWYVGHVALGILERTLGNFEAAIPSLRASISLDPLNADLHQQLGLALNRSGRFRDALIEDRLALEISPNIGFGHQDVAYDLLAMGDLDAALSEAQLETDEAVKPVALAIIYHAVGRSSESDAALAQAIQVSASDKAWEIASVYASRGDMDNAIAWLERAYKQRDFELLFLKGDPAFRSLEGDPRYAAFLRKMNLP